MSETGRLVVVGTPIGNLGDLTPRATEELRSADVIACEDTRRTGRLLQMTGVGRRPLLVANEHTELRRSNEIVDRILAGETVALVSDAGMPGISDPGERVVRAVIEAGLPVEVAPGPTAMTTALVLSGLATDRFVFEGFLPRKGRERSQRLAEVATEPRTMVIYESPKRVASTLVDLSAVCGKDRPAAAGRELTKLHEEVLRGTLADLADRLARSEPRGEFVLVIAGAPVRGEAATDDELLAALRAAIDEGASRRDAVAAVMASTGEPKRRIYDLANTL